MGENVEIGRFALMRQTRKSLAILIVKIHNDGTGTEQSANYNCEILVTISPTELQLISMVRVEGHKRSDGWRKLLQSIAEDKHG